MKKIFLRQDLNEFWYAIPADLVKKFDKDINQIGLIEDISFKVDKLDKFNEDYGDFMVLSLDQTPFFIEE